MTGNKQEYLSFKTGGLTSHELKIGRTHGAPYRAYGYVPLRFGGERR